MVNDRRLAASPDVLSTQEAAAFLGVSRVTVYRWVKGGFLSRCAWRSPGKASVLRFSRVALEQFRDGLRR